MTENEFTYTGWAVVELMGHRRLGGHVSGVTFAGQPMILVQIPAALPAESFVATQLYSASALYCLTPCGEAEARAVAAANQPQPVHRWEMPAVLPHRPHRPHRPDAGDAEDDPEVGDDWDPGRGECD